MEDKILFQSKLNKIREMENPTILMNADDFDSLKEELEQKVTNFSVGIMPTYQGYPLKTSSSIERGAIIIYDDVLYPCWICGHSFSSSALGIHQAAVHRN